MAEGIEVLVELSRERIAEHEPHGWRIATELYSVFNGEHVDGYWMYCTCGWTGWIMKGVASEMKDVQEQPV
jgi:hypothetical protein